MVVQWNAFFACVENFCARWYRVRKRGSCTSKSCRMKVSVVFNIRKRECILWNQPLKIYMCIVKWINPSKLVVCRLIVLVSLSDCLGVIVSQLSANLSFSTHTTTFCSQKCKNQLNMHRGKMCIWKWLGKYTKFLVLNWMLIIVFARALIVEA